MVARSDGDPVIIGYCRVSTDKEEQDNSIEGQEHQLYEHGCHKVYAERRSAYKKYQRRPQWEKFKKAIESGMVKKAVLINLQRTSRQCEAEGFFARCKELGVEVELLDGTSTDMDAFDDFVLVRTMETVNKMESMMKSKAVKAGMARRRAAGASGIGKCPFGYRYDGIGPVPDEENWEKAKLIWKTLSENEFKAPPTIRQLGLDFSSAGLYKWMRNPIHVGQVRGYRNCVPTTCEPLITQELFDKCQMVLRKSYEAHPFFKRRRSANRSMPLSKLVVCQKCGSTMSLNKQAGKYRIKHFNPRCEWYGRGLAEFKVRDQVIEALMACASETADVAARPAEAQLPDQETVKELELLRGMAAKGLPVGEAIRELEDKLRNQNQRVGASANWEGMRDLFARRSFWDEATEEELRELFLEFVDEVVYLGNPHTVEVRISEAARGYAA